MRIAVAALFALLSSSLSLSALAADPSKPHEHQGILKPYPKPPKPVRLSDADKATLAAGGTVMRQMEGEGGGRGQAIFEVNAPAAIVWALVTDFPSFPKYIPEVKYCQPYAKGDKTIDVQFQLKSFPVTLDYYIHHDLDPVNHWMTWTLDYSKQSDLDDSVGFWRITPLADNPNRSLVEYSTDIALKGWVPAFVKDVLVTKGLKQSTTWVKREAEKRAGTAKP